MSVSEQVSGVAKSAIEGLKGSPNCIVALLLIGLIAVLNHLAAQKDAERAHLRMLTMMERCFPAAQPKPEDTP